MSLRWRTVSAGSSARRRGNHRRCGRDPCDPRKRQLAIAKGIKIVSGNSRGEVIRIRNSEGRDIAHGVSRYNSDALRLIAGQHSQQIDAILGYEYGPVAVHRDDMIIR